MYSYKKTLEKIINTKQENVNETGIKKIIDI